MTAAADDYHIVVAFWSRAPPGFLPALMVVQGITGKAENGVAIHIVLVVILVTVPKIRLVYLVFIYACLLISTVNVQQDYNSHVRFYLKQQAIQQLTHADRMFVYQGLFKQNLLAKTGLIDNAGTACYYLMTNRPGLPA